MPIGGLITGLGSLLGGALNSNAIGNASQTQANAAAQATALQKQEFNVLQQALVPFQAGGTQVFQGLTSLLGTGGSMPVQNLLIPPSYTFGNAPTLQGANNGQNLPQYNANPSMSNVAPYMPPIDFLLQQGANTISNAGSGVQGAVSGNMLQALQKYGSDLGTQNWQQGYTNYLQNYGNQFNADTQGYLTNYNAAAQGYNTNIGNQQNYLQSVFNMLSGASATGENAAAGVGQGAQNYANSASNYLTQGANAISAGQIGQTQALTGGLTSALGQANTPNSGGNSSIGSALNYIFGIGGGPNLTSNGTFTNADAATNAGFVFPT